MKILRVLPSMDFGGIERGVFDFSLKAAEMGHKVIVASGGGRFIAPLRERGIKWYSVSMDRKNILSFFNSRRRLKKIIHEEKPDIIHVQSRFPCWVASCAMESFPDIPWVTSIHNFHGLRPYSRSVGKGDRVITVSNALRRHAIESLRIEPGKIRVVYNGIDRGFADIMKEQQPVFTVGMIARLSGWKGHFIFLEALKKLHVKGMDIRGLIAGSGSRGYREKLERWIHLNGLDAAVKIVHMDAREALSKMNVLVVPSLEPEGFGRTVVEAQMAKTPVIATGIGAVPELVADGITGFIIEPGSSAELAKKIRYIAVNPSVSGQITEAAYRQALKRFTMETMFEGTMKVYSELL